MGANYFGCPIKLGKPDEIARETMKAKRIEIIGGYVFGISKSGIIYVSSDLTADIPQPPKGEKE